MPNDGVGEATISYIGPMTAIGDKQGAAVLDAVFDVLSVRAVGCIDHGDCDDDDVCTYDQCIAKTCTNTAAAYGDVDGDGTIDIFDLFCIVDGFAGNFEVCPIHADDIQPCGGNAVIDIFDLFALLNAFAGNDPCCKP